MAKEKKQAQSPKAEKKRRWYHNIHDAYKVTSRTYPWVGWLLGGAAVIIIALGVLIGVSTGKTVFWVIAGVLFGVMAAMVILSLMLRPAMYKQLDGTVGSVYSVISQIKRGWIVEEEPIEVTKSQDVLWRLVGRPGVILVSEGPTSRVSPMLANERRRVSRIVTNVPVVTIQCGNGEGQVPLAKLQKKINGLKKVLTKQEVPAVAARLNAVSTKGIPIPKGVDPTNTRGNRRALRGK